jgi:uncharacterized protein YecE (DUF72 family)
MIYLGTSGFRYFHWRESFYPKDLSEREWLAYYSKYFDTVELNVTFYRLPTEATFERWQKETPDNFIFVLKGSRYITHNKKLNNVEEPLELFMSGVEILKDKVGVILWQFPPSYKINLDRLEDFLKLLKNYNYKYALEFRNETWFSQETYQILGKYNACLVFADTPRFPYHEIITTNFVYFRLHGSKKLYGSDYSEKELSKWSERIKKYSTNKDVYVYFDNDNHGYAVKNALELKRLINK